MGLSSSQARLLNLTRRMHDIEYKAQNLEAQKLQMANDSKAVYHEYENALNKQKVQFKQIDTDGSAKYVDANLNTLLEAGYRIKLLSGSTWYDYTGGQVAAGANASADNFGSFENTITSIDLKSSTTERKAGSTVTAGGVTYRLAETIPAGANNTTDITAKGYKAATASANAADEKGALATLDFSNKEILRNLVEAGFIVFEKPMSDGSLAQVNIATDTNLQEVSDPVELKKAEAKYEADMRKIDAKDKKFDTDLAALEQERNAIKTEMDTLKTVAKDNVDRTFKLFS